MHRLIPQDDLVSLTVLALLAEKPCHPYEMMLLIRQRNKFFVNGLPRSLYRSVDRLRQVGYVEAFENEREGNRPERTVFRITDQGRRAFLSWLKELLGVRPPETSLFTAAVSFLPFLSQCEALEVLRSRKAVLEALLAPMEETLREVGPLLPRVHLLETEHTRALIGAERDWLAAVVSDIEKGQLEWESLATPSKEGAIE